MKPYRGRIDGMIGPGKYGYVDRQHIYLGTDGSIYIEARAGVYQEGKNSEGTLRLPLWSDENDHVLIACPQDIQYVFGIADSPDPGEEGLVYVDDFVVDIAYWRHDVHPRSPDCSIETFSKTVLSKSWSTTIVENRAHHDWAQKIVVNAYKTAEELNLKNEDTTVVFDSVTPSSR